VILGGSAQTPVAAKDREKGGVQCGHRATRRRWTRLRHTKTDFARNQNMKSNLVRTNTNSHLEETITTSF
jgi:hypothetical protein